MRENRFGEVIAGLILLMIGFGAFAESGIVALILIGFGFYMLSRQNSGRGGQVVAPIMDEIETLFTRTTSSRPSRSRYSEPDDNLASFRAKPDEPQFYRHARAAIRQAGQDPESLRVLPLDLGVIGFDANGSPSVYRANPADDEATYIQPYVQLRLPTKAAGRIRFELIDGDGQTLFIHEDHVHLKAGDNFITPTARLRMHDGMALHKKWELRVSADDVLLASHTFEWSVPVENDLRRHLSGDGEIMSDELRAALAESRLRDNISLDDLLADQNDGSEQQIRR